jgi:hypothetical protein
LKITVALCFERDYNKLNKEEIYYDIC